MRQMQGIDAGHRCWSIGAEVRHMHRAESKDVGNAHMCVAQLWDADAGLGTGGAGFESEAWVQGAGAGRGYGAQVQGMGAGRGCRAWA